MSTSVTLRLQSYFNHLLNWQDGWFSLHQTFLGILLGVKWHQMTFWSQSKSSVNIFGHICEIPRICNHKCQTKLRDKAKKHIFSVAWLLRKCSKNVLSVWQTFSLSESPLKAFTYICLAFAVNMNLGKSVTIY